MLQLRGISKTYKTGDLVQTALKDVKISFRENEFVSILGPSGSGKTTLLNIIGGLDRYDSGDLVINNVSTKKYRDRDWDSYRNHTVGFVFQSYNLIPHQTVLSNVELALTIGGISKKGRKARALEALDKVGLKDQAHKKPNQLSGGQMQRVAIARALVNDPKILLADEPTGALDTNTSVQVMDLLREVAKDRLVVMVTHNPDLANEYSTRIVNLRDGEIIGDSNPFNPKDEGKAVHKNLGKASMSKLTSLGLSLNNLMTKKGRTILTAFAGSIGIIGIALILSLSTGFQNYIDKIQEDTMVSYPLTIESETTDFVSMILTMQSDTEGLHQENTLVEQQFISSMETSIRKNDLKSLKKHLETHKDDYEGQLKQIRYSYTVTPLIYTIDATGKLAQINPNDSLNSLGGTSGYMAISSVSMSAFSEVMNADSLKNGRTLLAGRWPEKYNEMAVVVSDPGQISDLLIYSLGFRDTTELKTLISNMMLGERPKEKDKPITITYDDLLNMELKLINPSDKYRYNEKYDIYEDMSGDEEYMRKVFENSESLKITAVLCAEGGSSMSAGVLYLPDLTKHVIELAAQSEILEKQMGNKNIDIFSGNPFDEEKKQSGLDFQDMISVDQNKISQAFQVNMPAISMEEGLDQDKIAELIKITSADIYDSISDPSQQTNAANTLGMLNAGLLNVFIEQFEAASTVADGENTYLNLAGVNFVPMMITGDTYKTAAENVNENLTMLLSDEDFAKLAEAVKAMFSAYYQPILSSPEVSGNRILYNKGENFTTYGTTITSLANLSTAMADVTAGAKVMEVVPNYVKNLSVLTTAAQIGTVVGQVTEPMAKTLSGLSDAFSGDIIKVDAEKLASAFTFSMDEGELSRIMSTMMSGSDTSYSNNLLKLGYQDIDDPTSIAFYFTDFESKNKFTDYLKEYNENTKDGEKLRYTDLTGILLKSVEKIINSVSYVLIAFVSISLVVSSIMIGIITYISVLERTKEIGILRALGASKKNISSIFNAETFIIGLLSGLVGIGITYILNIPINSLIHKVTENYDITAVLEPRYALALVIIATVLTIIGGLIPSKSASKKDPVIALRTE